MTTATATYEISTGGPIRRFERIIHLTRGVERDWMRRAVALGALVHVPLLLFGIGSRLVTGEWPFVIQELSTHTRALVAIPLLLFAQRLVDDRARVFGDYLLTSGIVRSDAAAYTEAVSRSIRLRDSAFAELALVALTIASLFSSDTYLGGQSLVRLAALPAVIVFRFLLLQWMWRWGLWIVFLWRLSKLPLTLRSTHPDRLAGLGPALGPSYAFAAVVAGCSAMLTGGWVDQMLYAGRTLSDFYDVAITFVVLALGAAYLPACVFVGLLYRVRKTDLAHYGALAQRYIAAFDARWLDAHEDTEAPSSADVSGLADLGGAYQVIRDTRVLPASRRLFRVIVAAALLPMLPLGLIAVGFISLLEQLGDLLL
jgi:hypothetical protein